MKQGFIKTAAVTPVIKVADPRYNAQMICERMKEAALAGAKIIVFPELCISGYTCGDLFLQEQLLEISARQLFLIAEASKHLDSLVFVGLPLEYKGKLYNAAAALNRGNILGFIPKYNIPNYSEFYEARHFTQGITEPVVMDFYGNSVPFGTNILFRCNHMKDLVVAAEICEDVWMPCPPSIRHGLAGATVIVNCSASDETTGKDLYRRSLITGQSARLVCGYIYAGAGEGESTTDLVFGGHNLIAENGTLLAQSERFRNETIYGDVDISRLISERRRMTSFRLCEDSSYLTVGFSLKEEETKLQRLFDPAPFVPDNKEDREKRCEEILSIQSMGLKQRLVHTGCRNAVVGISGGLDSTLALLVTVRSFDLCGIARKNITAVTMPCFGTTDRTYGNAVSLIRQLGADFVEVDIRDAVESHFRDIGHDPLDRDVTYENAQARERTQVLMDIANQTGGMVVGTGDMSELALGWATYNGDHMSMYGVNSSVPKTLVRHLVSYYGETCQDQRLREVLLDILATPVSPELLPPREGKIIQKTEDIVGPYELHDFFMYYVLRFGFAPGKIFRIARIAFGESYDAETILKWLKVFYHRFFSQQFKRSCLPDGPKVGSVGVSPRGDLRMPSDACGRVWLEDLENIL